MPQDIAEVVLNLINNAFYAVNEKKKQLTMDMSDGFCRYKKRYGKIEISVNDNW
jgi:sensor histidine kinase regulating citrate/malate metabolism